MQRFIAFGAALVMAVSGCWYGGNSNGVSSNLTFAMAGGSIGGTNLPLDLVVVRYPSQWQNICSEPASRPMRLVGGVHVAGGDPCGVIGNSTLATTAITLTKASCDGAACDVVADAAIPGIPAGALVLRVTPKHAGRIVVNVSVRANDGSGSWSDAYSFLADDVTHVGFTHEIPDDAPATVGVLAGAPISWTPVATAQDGTLLAATGDAFAVSQAGRAIGPGGSSGGNAGVALSAQTVGTATLTVDAAGKSTTESINVVDPNDVRRLDLFRSIDVPDTGTYLDVEASVFQGKALTEIDFDHAYEQGPYVVVLTMADGSHALGGAATVTVQNPAVYVQPETKALYGWTFDLHADDATSIGETTLTAQVGQATLTIPVHPAPPYDFGDDAGGDDGGRDAAGGGDAADAGGADSAAE